MGLKGFFFSTSSLSGTANEWYEELSVSEKENFEIYAKEKLVDLLLHYGMLIGQEKISQILKKNNTTNLQLGIRHIVLFRSALYIVQIFNIDGKPYKYIILTSQGEIASKIDTNKMKKLASTLRRLHPIDVAILDKVLLNLLDMRSKTISEISAEIIETSNDIEFALTELKNMGVIHQLRHRKEVSYKINTKLNAFYRVAERLLSNKFRYDLLLSPFIEIVTNDSFLKHLQNRFKVNLSEEDRRALLKIIRYFPSALNLILFRDTTDYRNRFDQITQSPWFESRKEKMYKEHFRLLLGELAQLVIVDLNSLPNWFIVEKKLLAIFY